MKKIVVLFILMISLCCSLYAGGFEEQKKFDMVSIQTIDVSLLKEKITVSTVKGNTIYVISETKNKSMFPFVGVEDATLTIRNSDYQYEEKDYCHISLMLPEQYVALNGSVSDWARDRIRYDHNGGGVSLKLDTFHGDIIISK